MIHSYAKTKDKLIQCGPLQVKKAHIFKILQLDQLDWKFHDHAEKTSNFKARVSSQMLFPNSINLASFPGC